MSEELCFVDVFIEEPGAVDVEVCKQGPAGPPGATGPAGPGVGEQIDFGAVLSSEDEDVDTIAVTSVQAVMYIITATDTAGDRRTIVVQANVIQNGTDASWTAYGAIGDAVPFTPTLSVSGGDLILNIANTHSLAFDISLLRFVTE